MCEILAPAGDEKSALAAINAGANAVYLGLKQFSARSSAENFDIESFERLVKYAHAFNVKVYVAMNTLVKTAEIEDFIFSAVSAWNAGADALIISDIFIGKYLKINYPEIVLHLSTQAGVCNVYGAKAAMSAGFSRVILSRETAFEDIREIASVIETEVFIQGALCTCFSGQCYLSSFAGGNSGNRGRCKQPCRKKYTIDRKGFEDPAYRISLSDLSVGEDINKLKEEGVYSFKIEGRMRRPEYVSAAVKYYKNILNGCMCDKDLSDLKRTFNRGNFTRGLLFGQDKSFLSSAVQGHIGEFVGRIEVKNSKYLCVSQNKFNSGDGFKILRDGKEVGGAVYVKDIKNGFEIASSSRLKNGDKVFITTDSLLNSELLNRTLKIPVNIELSFKSGKKPKIWVNGKVYEGENELSAAINSPISIEDIKKCFNKTDKYPYSVTFGKIYLDKVFVSSSELNAIRRSVFENYFNYISQNTNKRFSVKRFESAITAGKNSKIAVICETLNGLNADVGILKPSDYSVDFNDLISNFSGEKYLYLPPFMTGKEIGLIKKKLDIFDGIYCEGIYGFELSSETKKDLFVGTGMNISNLLGVSLSVAKYVALSKELTINEAGSLATCNTFYFTCGAIKVMDLIYCPFEKKCATCDRRANYKLKDENGREFTLRRYNIDSCRFELYNCADLVSEQNFTGLLAELTLTENPDLTNGMLRNGENLRNFFRNRTQGHSVKPIL